ncbi:hypothetical protein EJB05_01196 [Eragrostis curvula]|uniref:Bet v I/Major latex protein domain-containing protein n=1 Tax=Eragrostis curvula TaxID=38414 RepID=A0A5J9WPL6_9POAL|nr:hypothetical protein EJB05_01196 [Eragrostis curvula]
MVAGSFSEEVAVTISADRFWKAAFTNAKSDLLIKACVGFIDAVDIDGDGGPGTVTTMKANPAVPDMKVLKTRVVAKDETARVVKTEVLEGGKVTAQLKSETAEMKVEAAGDGACVVKVTVEYERDGGPLAPEDQAKVVKAYLGLVKKVEAYLVANPNEFA